MDNARLDWRMVELIASFFALLVSAALTRVMLVPLGKRWIGARSKGALAKMRAVIGRHPEMRLLSEAPPKLGFLFHGTKATLELVPPALDDTPDTDPSSLEPRAGVTSVIYFLPKPGPKLFLATARRLRPHAAELMGARGYPGAWTLASPSPDDAARLLTRALRDAIGALEELWVGDVVLSLDGRRLTVQIAGWLSRDAELIERTIDRASAVAEAIASELHSGAGE